MSINSNNEPTACVHCGTTSEPLTDSPGGPYCPWESCEAAAEAVEVSYPPNVTWLAIQDALRDNDTKTAVAWAVALGGWLNGGGSYPKFTLGTADKSEVWAVLNFLMTLGIDAD